MTSTGFNITLSELAHAKIKHWVDKTSREVSGVGITSMKKEDNKWCVYVRDVYLLEQEVGAAHTDIDAKAMAKLMHKVLVDPETRAYKLNFWWHSHVKMNTFWSGTDVETIKSIGKNGLCIASVFNQQGDIRSAVCYKTNSSFGDDCSLVDEVMTYTEVPDDPRVKDWDAEFDANVRTQVLAPTTATYVEGRTLAEYEADWNKNQQLRFPDNRDLEDAHRYGLLGFGIEKEAEVLGMKPKKYQRMLKENDKQTLIALEQRLEGHWEEGRLE